jgi:hypothetical protein
MMNCFLSRSQMQTCGNKDLFCRWPAEKGLAVVCQSNKVMVFFLPPLISLRPELLTARRRTAKSRDDTYGRYFLRGMAWDAKSQPASSTGPDVSTYLPHFPYALTVSYLQWAFYAPCIS